MLELSTEARVLAGILVLAVVAIESGGWVLTMIATGAMPATEWRAPWSRSASWARS